MSMLVAQTKPVAVELESECFQKYVRGFNENGGKKKNKDPGLVPRLGG